MFDFLQSGSMSWVMQLGMPMYLGIACGIVLVITIGCAMRVGQMLLAKDQFKLQYIVIFAVGLVGTIYGLVYGRNLNGVRYTEIFTFWFAMATIVFGSILIIGVIISIFVRNGRGKKVVKTVETYVQDTKPVDPSLVKQNNYGDETLNEFQDKLFTNNLPSGASAPTTTDQLAASQQLAQVKQQQARRQAFEQGLTPQYQDTYTNTYQQPQQGQAYNPYQQPNTTQQYANPYAQPRQQAYANPYAQNAQNGQAMNQYQNGQVMNQYQNQRPAPNYQNGQPVQQYANPYAQPRQPQQYANPYGASTQMPNYQNGQPVNQYQNQRPTQNYQNGQMSPSQQARGYTQYQQVQNDKASGFIAADATNDLTYISNGRR
jgi:hypothetical protein